MQYSLQHFFLQHNFVFPPVMKVMTTDDTEVLTHLIFRCLCVKWKDMAKYAGNVAFIIDCKCFITVKLVSKRVKRHILPLDTLILESRVLKLLFANVFLRTFQP
jgi:hypothetical protein